MLVLSINIRGLKRDENIGWLRDICAETKPYIIALQETKCDEINEKFVEIFWGSSNFKFVQKGSSGRSGGIALVWDSEMFQAIQAVEGDFYLAVKGRFKGQSSDVIIVNVYGPHEDRKKRLFFDSLEKLLEFDNEDWILCGDFNEFRHEDERRNCKFIQRKAIRFNSFISKTSLIEVPLVGKRFTRICDNEEIIRQAWNEEVYSKRLDVCFRLKLKRVKQALKSWSKENFDKLDSEIEQAKLETTEWEKIADSRDLFKEPEKKRSTFPDIVSNKLLDSDVIHLEKRFDEQEVCNAIKGCGGSKALGPEGFNLKFYKRFWNIIKDDLMVAIDWFWDKGEISYGCNASFMTLIRKTNDPMDLGDYRPISLINSYYKIIAKILSNRVRERMGFGKKWIKWIELYFKAATISILVNGSPTEEFKLERGIRQGDPLSPFLFIIAGEGLNLLYNEAIRKGLVRGVKIGKDIPFSHLQYADDSIFIGLWMKRNLNNALKVIKCFEDVSGLKINLVKRKLIGIGVEASVVGKWQPS
ncbi:uncharacterized protein [Rutidosis leptorrhynchoides]|uniref:uncharacterized protein n=1 Tax=Rutidosis leptorrhynchoides TaxID=125765 RepID=UPI003A98F66B